MPLTMQKKPALKLVKIGASMKKLLKWLKKCWPMLSLLKKLSNTPNYQKKKSCLFKLKFKQTNQYNY